MTEQRKMILQSANYLKGILPKGFKPSIALTTEAEFKIEKLFKVLKTVNCKDIPPGVIYNQTANNNKLVFAKSGKRDIILLSGRLHYFDGATMRQIGHIIYALKYLGIKTIISTEEVANLNPRFKCGELSLIYDHINLMGNNPLIGENDDEIGLRFPDMSNAYDSEIFQKAVNLFIDEKLKINESVYLGITGPESETEAEARFYREIGSDILGYSLIPENITAVHCNLKFLAVGLITRNLIADKMLEDTSSEFENIKEKNEHKKNALKLLSIILPKLISKI
ncbi:hypothetical protein D4R20_03475 [bacterium]|nr:MAG: hypothetical protein D4R20_03475 [bacterium]